MTTNAAPAVWLVQASNPANAGDPYEQPEILGVFTDETVADQTAANYDAAWGVSGYATVTALPIHDQPIRYAVIDAGNAPTQEFIARQMNRPGGRAVYGTITWQVVLSSDETDIDAHRALTEAYVDGDLIYGPTPQAVTDLHLSLDAQIVAALPATTLKDA
jgi:hypothetical protein